MTTTLQQLAEGQTYPEVPINRNFETAGYIAIFGKRPAVTTGLTWGYYGGRYNGTLVADGTLTLTNAAANHVVAHRGTGVVTVATTTTNWDDTATYARLYKCTAAGGVVTAVEDWRFGATGLIAPPGAVAASAVGIADAAGYYTGTTVEAALQEAGADAVALAEGLAALAEAQISLYVDGQPAAGEVLERFTARVPFTLAASGAGCSSTATVAATAQADFIVQKNGATACTVRFAAAGTTATFIGSATAWAVGDVFKLIAPATQDATLSDIDISLLVTRS
jgi:hypothetical protein